MKSLFSEMYLILEAMKNRNLEPALNWATANSIKLKEKGSDLLLKLHCLQFVEILQGGSRSKALSYVRTHISPFGANHFSEIQKLMACLLWSGKLHQSPYSDLLSPTNWNVVAEELTRQFCNLLGQSFDSPLSVTIAAGFQGLPPLLKFMTVMAGKKQEWQSMKQLPVPVELDREFQFHSIFVCPVSKEQSTDENPPMLMQCGHVLCKQSINKMSKNGSRTFKCPYCPSDIDSTQHSLGFIVGCGKPFPPVFISQCVGYYCKCPHSTIKPVACGAVSQAGNAYFKAQVKASGTWFSSCLLLRLVSTLWLVTSFMGISNVLADAPAAEISSKNYTNYLQKACHSTTYPQLCLESLSSYTSTIETDYLKLCSTALTVTLKAASNTSSLVKALSKQRGLSKTEAGIIKDCIEETGDSVDELKRSLDAFGSLQGSDIQFQISNIQTWISAAITDENTCTQGFDDRKISDEVMRKIRMKIVIVARLTSNALALINKLSY
uniref:RING-type domain-containing protein n=1 Tax=Salix viminalis TaxID=40686 RepID=A0A6N2NDE9_SALVM